MVMRMGKLSTEDASCKKLVQRNSQDALELISYEGIMFI